jgi:hypothetical protein
VELWATRWRRPSAAGKSTGLLLASYAATYFVARIMLIA